MTVREGRMTHAGEGGAKRVQEAAFAYVGAFVDELARAGARHVCICPGSRSTPLAMLCADHSDVCVWMHVDERSAAFFALGLAKATGEPVALVATSGTAVTNFMPAVTEAYFGRVPLLLLTADRPHEYRDVGNNQTIDQVRLFGSHVKWFVDMALPEASETMVRYARTVAARAVATARGVPAGPVHVNIPFREPLIPQPSPAVTESSVPRNGRKDGVPYAHVVDGPRTLPKQAAAELAFEWARVQRGIVVCGPDTPVEAAGALLELAGVLQWPVLADPLSGLRTVGAAVGEVIGDVIDAYDVFLRNEDVATRLEPELIVRFGALPVSKPLLQYLQRYPDVPHVVVDGGGGWRDATLSASAMLHVDAWKLCAAVTDALRADARAAGDRQWVDGWHRLNKATRTGLRHAVDELPDMFEGRVFQELARWLPDGAALFVGNSMPIRDMDAFFPVIDRRVDVFGNRGVSGIDGVVSSALGVSAVHDGPVVLVLGDLSFYHDLNGLLAAKRHDLHATIIVINNDGGGIFSFLPQTEHPEHFEMLFGTPIGLDFEPAVGMYGGRFTRVDDWDGFRRAVERGIGGNGLHVVEIVTERARNARQHRDVIGGTIAALTPMLETLVADGRKHGRGTDGR